MAWLRPTARRRDMPHSLRSLNGQPPIPQGHQHLVIPVKTAPAALHPAKAATNPKSGGGTAALHSDTLRSTKIWLGVLGGLLVLLLLLAIAYRRWRKRRNPKDTKSQWLDLNRVAKDRGLTARLRRLRQLNERGHGLAPSSSGHHHQHHIAEKQRDRVRLKPPAFHVPSVATYEVTRPEDYAYLTWHDPALKQDGPAPKQDTAAQKSTPLCLRDSSLEELEFEVVEEELVRVEKPSSAHQPSSRKISNRRRKGRSATTKVTMTTATTTAMTSLTASPSPSPLSDQHYRHASASHISSGMPVAMVARSSSDPALNSPPEPDGGVGAFLDREAIFGSNSYRSSSHGHLGPPGHDSRATMRPGLQGASGGKPARARWEPGSSRGAPTFAMTVAADESAGAELDGRHAGSGGMELSSSVQVMDLGDLNPNAIGAIQVHTPKALEPTTAATVQDKLSNPGRGQIDRSSQGAPGNQSQLPLSATTTQSFELVDRDQIGDLLEVPALPQQQHHQQHQQQQSGAPKVLRHSISTSFDAISPTCASQLQSHSPLGQLRFSLHFRTAAESRRSQPPGPPNDNLVVGVLRAEGLNLDREKRAPSTLVKIELKPPTSGDTAVAWTKMAAASRDPLFNEEVVFDDYTLEELHHCTLNLKLYCRHSRRSPAVGGVIKSGSQKRVGAVRMRLAQLAASARTEHCSPLELSRHHAKV